MEACRFSYRANYTFNLVKIDETFKSVIAALIEVCYLERSRQDELFLSCSSLFTETAETFGSYA